MSIINSIISTLASTVISSGISLFINLHNPRTKLEIVPYKVNMGIQQYMGNTPKCIVQFCLLSNKIGWFKLTKAIYKSSISNYTIVYDENNNINKFSNNKHMVKFTSRIFVTLSKPSVLFSFDYNKLKSFKQSREKECNSKLQEKYPNNTIPLIHNTITGDLICYFKNNDKKQKEIKCKI